MLIEKVKCDRCGSMASLISGTYNNEELFCVVCDECGLCTRPCSTVGLAKQSWQELLDDVIEQEGII